MTGCHRTIDLYRYAVIISGWYLIDLLNCRISEYSNSPIHERIMAHLSLAQYMTWQKRSMTSLSFKQFTDCQQFDLLTKRCHPQVNRNRGLLTYHSESCFHDYTHCQVHCEVSSSATFGDEVSTSWTVRSALLTLEG